jgi:hypothetical protein
MTVEAAEHALMAPLKLRDIAFTDARWVTERADGKDDGLSYVVQNGKIVIISLLPIKGQKTSLHDTRGIGIGATGADILTAYGQVKITRAPCYDEESEIEVATTRAKLDVKQSEPQPSPHYWIEVESPNHERAIIFDTQDSKVTSLMTGSSRPLLLLRNACGLLGRPAFWVGCGVAA